MYEDVEHKMILTHYLYQKPQKYINMLSYNSYNSCWAYNKQYTRNYIIQNIYM